MPNRQAKKRMSRKNVLTLVRASIFALFALILAVAASLAWFYKGPPQMDFLIVDVKGKINADVKLFYRDGLTEREEYYGVDLSSLTSSSGRPFLDTTKPSSANYLVDREAFLTPGSGDYYKLEIKLLDAPYSAEVTVELIGIKWNNTLLAQYNITTSEIEEISEHILLRSFFDEGGFKVDEKLVFVQDSQGNYGSNLAFVMNKSLSGNVSNIYNLYFWIFIHTDFSIGFAGELFTVDHIRVSLE